MRFSSLLDEIPPYPFPVINKLVKEMRGQGIDVIRATIGSPDREAPQKVKNAMSGFVRRAGSTQDYPIDKYDDRGIPKLIEAIIEDYREKHGVELKPENIAVTDWTKPHLMDLAELFAAGTMLLPDPVYPAYMGGVVLSHHDKKIVKTSEETGWLPRFEFTDDDVAFYHCDPNNPTGSVGSMDHYMDLQSRITAQKNKGKDVGGIFDKPYKDFVFDAETKPVSITQVPGLMEDGFEVVSYSKHNNFVGIGLGWIVSSEDNINRWLKYYGKKYQGVEWYKQMAGIVALRDPDAREEIEGYMSELKERRDVLVEGLNSVGIEAKPPKATPYVWFKVPEAYNDEEFVKDVLLKEAHVAFMPGSYFGESGKGYARATLYIPTDRIEEGINRIAKTRADLQTW